MKDLPWFTIATLLVTLSNAIAGLAGSLTPEQASIAATASVVLGGIGKAIYNIGEGLKPRNLEVEIVNSIDDAFADEDFEA